VFMCFAVFVVAFQLSDCLPAVAVRVTCDELRVSSSEITEPGRFGRYSNSLWAGDRFPAGANVLLYFTASRHSVGPLRKSYFSHWKFAFSGERGERERDTYSVGFLRKS
jgi:hypothetical protein